MLHMCHIYACNMWMNIWTCYISGSLNKQQFLPSLIARLIHVQSRLSSCSISSKLTSSPETGPVEDPLGGNYSVILHSSFALETDKLSYSKKSSRSSVGVLSSLKIFLNLESWDSKKLESDSQTHQQTQLTEISQFSRNLTEIYQALSNQRMLMWDSNP